MALQNSSVKRLFSAAFQLRSYSAPAERSIPQAKQKYIPTSGTYPKGFLAGSAHAGVKASNTKYDDLALIASETPCVGTAVFTQNVFKAAPVTVSDRIIRQRGSEGIRGIVVNSGCANAVTGVGGMEDAMAMARETDKCFATEQSETPQTLVMSTGVIGQRLPIDRITSNIPKLHASLGTSHEHWLNCARAICTTDTFPKLISRTFTLPSHPETTYSIAGMTKGAGMIHPNMATLLSMICTDASVAPTAIKHLLRHATNTSFNCISIDGDTSTNDTVALLANGAAAPATAQPLSSSHPDYAAFQTILTDFMVDLAQLVVRDGEGATKFVTIRVSSDQSYYTARRAATSIATSALVKTALYGKDANWGRILCAIGYAPGIMERVDDQTGTGDEYLARQDGDDLQVVPARTSVSFVPADGSEELKLLVRGEPEEVNEERAKAILEQEDLEILVRLDDGEPMSGRESQVCTFWTCDFSHEYVTINGDYRT